MTVPAETIVAMPADRGRKRNWLQSESATGLGLISPTLIYALIFLVVPILLVIANSFWTQHYLVVDRTFTLENYRIAVTDPIYRDLLMRSLWISLLVSFFTVVLAYLSRFSFPFMAAGTRGCGCS